MIKRGKVSTESDELKLCRSKHNCLRRTKLKNNTGKWCLSFANNLYTARFQQERIPVDQRRICHSRLLWICHSKSLDLSSRFDALLLLSISVYTAGHFVQRGGAGGNGAPSRNAIILVVEIPPSTMVQPVHRDGLG